MGDSRQTQPADWIRSALFADLSDAALTALAEAAERRTIKGGDYLVRQGDDADALYFVSTGHFRVIITDEAGQQKTVARIESGEPVGELAFFAGGTRTASLQASRDSEVMALDRAAYDKVAKEYPEVTAALLKAVSKRLADVTAKTPSMATRTSRVIACLNAGGSTMPEGLLDRLAEQMRAVLGSDAKVHIVRQADVPGSGDADYQQWLYARESAGEWLLIEANGEAAWSTRATRNADALLLFADAQNGDPSINDHERAAFTAIDADSRTLAIVRQTSDAPIERSLDWLKDRDPHLHHHIALDSDGDFARLARFMTGNAVGLVLAGGGALGCAHLGIVRGLRQSGVPIDYIGGTSAGAAMGGAIAQGLSVEETLDQMEAMFIEAKAMKRFTVPVHSLLDPAVFDHELSTRYSQKDIADQPLGFFAISTNLSTNDLFIHRHGPLWEAVRASGSLPTILPPFIDSDGNILIDGGVLDNIPVTVMRKIKPGPNIVVGLGDTSTAWRIDAEYNALRSRVRLARDVLLRRPAPDDFPSIVDIMSRSMVVASRIASRSMLSDNDILLQPPIIEGMQILDWHLGREQAEKAAEYVAQQLGENEELARLAS
ncbi:cyclic nucleotide-binding and patatin-like phospholipase domain-containing protein [Alterisphingorhabdus coralli]|uniref:Cyclic nucleotide-binding and patatin-like phospholipase domain-containing protein n=1 Tax=Alterisphingorhabdus coralli TaxID=3071408 RepID=A0AA97F9S7_9SPHN|nr:cyclic nucleotide-binding and patatin-like phospholipase domain-containing protein [Parasphingorhabdus sp. SCSIO 66989]WOE75672.1 cyclic nucleotide-binding and patatin-like phospholipase domain-containing protein [Parasphingorhabdus sp. SCSIO 66989]